ncbi:MAG: hypothetical protein ACKVRP_05725 [Bacteroidota bacterium]
MRITIPTWRIALFALTLGCILWLGGVHFRAIMGNDLLKTGTLEFEEYLAPEAEREVFRLMSLASLVIITGYGIVLASSIVFLISTPLKMKEHGWLTMSAVLYYLFVPVEVFTMYIDGRMIYHEFFTTADNGVFRELFIARMGALAGTPFIALLSYYTIIAIIVFQPLKKPQHHTT